MKFIDLEDFADGHAFESDLCIVGSGPAGATIAMEFAKAKIRVLVLEGGGLEQTAANQALYDVQNVGALRMEPQDLARNRVVGGSSHTWSGRCAALSDIDFEPRAWIPHSGWPIGLNELRPFYDRACGYVGLGPNIYDDGLWQRLGNSPPRRTFDANVLQSQFWQYSRDGRNPREPRRFAGTLADVDAPNVDVLMHANVTRLNVSKDGSRIESLDVRTLTGRRMKAKAAIVVLACGALENARLLLASNDRAPRGLGNNHDLVGRYLMDHPGCILGWFDPRRAFPIQNRFAHYLLEHKGDHHAYHFGVTVSTKVQRDERLLNCAAFFEQAPSADRSWEALKRLIRNGRPDRSRIARDAVDVVTGLPRVVGNVYRRIARRQGPILPSDELLLRCLVEQTPNPESRVTLAQKTDALDMPLLRIDWKIGDLERRSVLRLSELIARELRRCGLPELSPNRQLLDDESWRTQFIDRAHPSGTTRMADSADAGVVDRNCQVHEINGLYIAGSSVFPTAGHANPTLTIVALAIRLADWLKHKEFGKNLVLNV